MLDDENPVTLAEACQQVFGDRIKPATLRAEAQRGNLSIFRVGRRDFTTIKSVREMVRKCQDAARLRASTSTQSENSGLSETERVSSAQAALSQTVAALKAGLPRISGRNTNQRVARRH